MEYGNIENIIEWEIAPIVGVAASVDQMREIAHRCWEWRNPGNAARAYFRPVEGVDVGEVIAEILGDDL